MNISNSEIKRFTSFEKRKDILKRWFTNVGKHIRECLLESKLSGPLLDYKDFRGCNLENETIEDQDLRFFDFKYTNFKNTVIRNIYFRKSNHESSNFSNSRIINSNFEGANLKYTTLNSTVFSNCGFVRAKFQGSKPNKTKWIKCDLTNTSFEKDDTNIDTVLEDVDLVECKLWGSRFNGTFINNTRIKDCQIYQIQNSGWSLNNIISEGVYFGPEKEDEFYQPFDDNLTFEDFFKHSYTLTKWAYVPKELRTATIQYLHYFKDYLEQTKGLSVEVESLFKGNKVGLHFRADSINSLKHIEEYLREYIGYMTGEKSIDYSHISKEHRLAYKQLEMEIFSLKNRIETQQILLEDYRDIISSFMKYLPSPKQANTLTHQTVNISTNISHKNNIKQVFNNELDSLLSIQKINKQQFQNLSELIQLLKDSNVEGNQKNIKENLQKIAKNKSIAKKVALRFSEIGKDIIISATGSATWALISTFMKSFI